MKTYLLLSLILLPFFCLSQQVCVLNSADSAAIKNVHIYCENYGEITGPDGMVDLAKLKTCDSIEFSKVGYESVKLELMKIPDTVFLEKEVVDLNEFALKAEDEKEWIGFTQRRWLPGQIGNMIGHTNGLIQKNIPRGRLSKVEVFVKNSCDHPENKLFLKVMSLDSSFTPKDDLLSNQVEIPAEKRGWVTIDIQDEFILVRDKIFLGVQVTRNSGLKENENSCFNMIGMQFVEVDSNYKRCWKNDSIGWIIRAHEEKPIKDKLSIPMIRAEVLH
ncbi:hypothetical protein [Salibacter halophilus]|uniref:Carboxypeptidase-like regulatory domain-containing protein n=1 Tax=Salibacter halophilus TaxID=1803916 RepID=A0A6N6M5P4_9FLAO|nr:hypothetical protein [Salibacter halophilus]KAB1063673.1 hypothetical protein F3059_08885 [Salibacter halophilus]